MLCIKSVAVIGNSIRIHRKELGIGIGTDLFDTPEDRITRQGTCSGRFCRRHRRYGIISILDIDRGTGINGHMSTDGNGSLRVKRIKILCGKFHNAGRFRNIRSLDFGLVAREQSRNSNCCKEEITFHCVIKNLVIALARFFRTEPKCTKKITLLSPNCEVLGREGLFRGWAAPFYKVKKVASYCISKNSSYLCSGGGESV